MLEDDSSIINDYFAKESLKYQGSVRLEEIERDVEERYLCTRQVENSGRNITCCVYDTFLTEAGAEECVRIADQNPLYVPRPRYSIRGVKGKEKFYVYQAVDTLADGQFGRLNYSFHYNYQIAEDNLISLETSYKIGKKIGLLESVLISWQKKVEQNIHQGSIEFVSKESKWRLRFENSKAPCLTLPESQQFFVPSLQASLQMRAKNGLHEFIFLPENKDSLVFCFTDSLNIAEWDRKISSFGREWRDLIQQFPIDSRNDL